MTKLNLFPNSKEIFLDEVEEHCKYLLPLATLDLSEINPSWNGSIHFVQPIEPYDGVVGENTKQFHTYYCRENWIGYSIKDGKFKLLTDFCYFEKKYMKTFDDFRESFYGVSSYLKNLPKDTDAHYTKIEKKYSKRKEAYLSGEAKYEEFVKYLELGGEAEEGNWSYTDFPTEIDKKSSSKGEETTFCYPLTNDGRRFEYIGYIEADDFGTNSCGLLLFYDDKEKIALNTFYWT